MTTDVDPDVTADAGAARLVEILRKDPDLDDQVVYDGLVEVGFDSRTSDLLLLFVVHAFGDLVAPEVLQGKADLPGHYRSTDPVLSGLDLLLADQPAYRAGQRLGERLRIEDPELLQSVARRSSTMRALSVAKASGRSLDGVKISAPHMPLTAEDLGIPVPTPWWKFWP